MVLFCLIREIMKNYIQLIKIKYIIKQFNLSLQQNLCIVGNCLRSDIDAEESGEGVQSFRTLDRASSHFSAGNVQEIRLKKLNG